MRASKVFTALWGAGALGIAFFFQFADNLIQAVNIIGSIFYGPGLLGLFIVAFFFRRVAGTAAFWGGGAGAGPGHRGRYSLFPMGNLMV